MTTTSVFRAHAECAHVPVTSVPKSLINAAAQTLPLRFFISYEIKSLYPIHNSRLSSSNQGEIFDIFLLQS
jgi:hypothetical protein